MLAGVFSLLCLLSMLVWFATRPLPVRFTSASVCWRSQIHLSPRYPASGPPPRDTSLLTHLHFAYFGVDYQFSYFSLHTTIFLSPLSP